MMMEQDLEEMVKVWNHPFGERGKLWIRNKDSQGTEDPAEIEGSQSVVALCC